MLSRTIREALSKALQGAGVSIAPADVPLEFPSELSHGDYASGVALAKAKEAALSPRALAEKVVLTMGTIAGVSKIDIAGPGFINFTLSPESVAHTIEEARQEPWGRGNAAAGKQMVFEYTDPNPFKAFHIGHLMSNAIGEALSRAAQFAGAKVVRANYQGDVGVHVACAIWGIKKLGIHPESADEFGRAYAAGAIAYKEDAAAKEEIDEINKKLYDRSDAELNALYDTGRKESLAAFEKIYAILGTKFDRYYFESETGPVGKDIVVSHPEIFPESDGARVFRGEEHGLHTRVFLSGKGLPTYEAKELGLGKIKSEEYPQAEALVVVTANEVSDYFRVIKKAMEVLFPDIAKKLVHIAHGMMKLPTGKMSSRTGEVITGEELLRELSDAAKERAKESRAGNIDKLAQDIAVGAIKYQILKQDSGKDIVFDRERALSLEGDSGPYLQYAHARTHQIVEKAAAQGIIGRPSVSHQLGDTGSPRMEVRADVAATPNEVARLLVRFPEIAARAARTYEPHLVTQYLLLVASAFNSWYAQEQILDGSASSPHKVAVADAVRTTLRHGLWLLGIPAPEKV